ASAGESNGERLRLSGGILNLPLSASDTESPIRPRADDLCQLYVVEEHLERAKLHGRKQFRPARLLQSASGKGCLRPRRPPYVQGLRGLRDSSGTRQAVLGRRE